MELTGLGVVQKDIGHYNSVYEDKKCFGSRSHFAKEKNRRYYP